MHPKIKEFAEQAKTRVPAGLGVDEWIERYNEIFAKLIVSECLEIVEDEDDGSTDTLAVRWAMHRIKKHFGVEE